jgi:hypothetical protein
VWCNAHDPAARAPLLQRVKGALQWFGGLPGERQPLAQPAGWTARSKEHQDPRQCKYEGKHHQHQHGGWKLTAEGNGSRERTKKCDRDEIERALQDHGANTAAKRRAAIALQKPRAVEVTDLCGQHDVDPKRERQDLNRGTTRD